MFHRILRLVSALLILILAAIGLVRLLADRGGKGVSGDSDTVTIVTPLAPVSRGQILSQFKLITVERQYRIPVLGTTYKPMPNPERDGVFGEVSQAVFGKRERVPGTTQNLVYEMVTTVTAGIDLGKLKELDIANGATVTTITLPLPEVIAVIHDAGSSRIFSQERPTVPFVGNPATLLEEMQKRGEKKHRLEAMHDEALMSRARRNAEESLLGFLKSLHPERQVVVQFSAEQSG